MLTFIFSLIQAHSDDANVAKWALTWLVFKVRWSKGIAMHLGGRWMSEQIVAAVHPVVKKKKR